MRIPTEDRDILGRFTTGNPGNPKGRPRKEPAPDEILNAMLPEALAKLNDLMHSDDEHIALQAATLIIEQALGKPEANSKFNVELHSDDIRSLSYAIRFFPDRG